MKSIQIERIDKGTFNNPGKLGVAPDQAAFVSSDLCAYVDEWKSDDSFQCFHIVLQGQPVGFFALDFSLERHRDYVSEPSGACVLRGFFVDQRYQGKGYSTACLRIMPAALHSMYPNLKFVYLTVNFKNPLAIKTYTKGGFETLAAPYLGGRAGPQHVMKRKI